jgi:hypothetical protein
MLAPRQILCAGSASTMVNFKVVEDIQGATALGFQRPSTVRTETAKRHSVPR